MIDFNTLDYGYSLDMNLTDCCNIECKHCYMKKSELALNKDDAVKIFSKIPKTLNRLVLSGGEPFLNYDVLYEILDIVRNSFSDKLIVRVTSNGKPIYDTDEHILCELKKLEKNGVNELLLSSDIYHYEAGIDKYRLQSVQSIAKMNDLKIKVKYLDIGKPNIIGEYKNKSDFEPKSCLNRKKNAIQPYLFMNTDGRVYLCAFRSTESIGNLITDKWEKIANNICKQFNVLSGNIFPSLIAKNDECDAIISEYFNFGECYICQRFKK